MAFQINGSVKSVVTNLQQSTYFEIYVADVGGGDYIGDVFADVDSINIEGPGGDLGVNKNDFTSFDKLDQFFLKVDEVPEEGSYTFSVTIGAETEQAVDTQGPINNIPLPSIESFYPAEGNIVPSGSISFSWELAPGNYYYAVDVRSISNEKIVRIPQGALDASSSEHTLSPGEYKWRLKIMDGSNWKTLNNRSQQDWIYFTVA